MRHFQRQCLSRSRAGFTLVELMVVVVIIAVLSTVAIASYKMYMRRTKITEAQTLLMDVKMKQEQYFSTYSQYISTAATATTFYPPSVGGQTSQLNWDLSSCQTASPTADVKGWCDLGFKPGHPTDSQLVSIGWNRTLGTTFAPSGYAFIDQIDPKQRWYYAVAHLNFGNGDYYILMQSQSRETVTLEP